ncbi:MAG: signal peptide peptidase SppA [Pirellulales bacterium]|nr:signal peptide peptidase SppA [Pirellulales bacterium]
MRRLALLGCAISLLFIYTAALQSAPAAEKEKPAVAKAEKPQSDVKKKDKAEDKTKAAKGKKAAAKKTKTAKGKKAAAKKPVVVKLTLGGDFPEGPAAPGLFGELKPTLAATIQRIDSAAKDKDVSAVWLKIEGLSIGRGKIHELRGAVARLRKAKKPVYAELTTADTNAYLLAASCDRIVMPSSGMLIVPGVRMEVTFYKGLLDKLGLRFDALKMGKYKGAVEPLTRKEMSKPLRESFESLANDNYEEIIATIATDRQLKDYQVKALLDRGLFTPDDAKKAGLIDDVLYPDQLQESLKKRLKAKEIKVVTNYKKKKIDTNFSGFSGMMKLAELMLGGKKLKKTGKKPAIAVVYAVGQIMEGKSRTGLFGSSSLGSTTLIAALRKAADNPRVKAIVLRIDSPGGSATASDLIWRETVRIRQPIIASMGDVAGSGGYYIAMGAKKIFAAPCTLTGSIGVIGGKLVTRGLYDKLGLNTEVISRGANSGALSSNQPFTPEERKAWITMLEETYRQFVGKAAEGRNMTFSKLEELAQGRVYTGRTAKKLGLIDQLGTLEDAIAAAKKAAGLKPGAEVDLLVLPESKSFFERLFDDPSASTDLESLLPDIIGTLRRTQLLRQLLSERILLWMPYEVRVK